MVFDGVYQLLAKFSRAALKPNFRSSSASVFNISAEANEGH